MDFSGSNVTGGIGRINNHPIGRTNASYIPRYILPNRLGIIESLPRLLPEPEQYEKIWSPKWWAVKIAI